MMMHTTYTTGIKKFKLQTAHEVKSVIFFVALAALQYGAPSFVESALFATAASHMNRCSIIECSII